MSETRKLAEKLFGPELDAVSDEIMIGILREVRNEAREAGEHDLADATNSCLRDLFDVDDALT